MHILYYLSKVAHTKKKKEGGGAKMNHTTKKESTGVLQLIPYLLYESSNAVYAISKVRIRVTVAHCRPRTGVLWAFPQNQQFKQGGTHLLRDPLHFKHLQS